MYELLSPWFLWGPEVTVVQWGLQLIRKSGCEVGENRDKREPLPASKTASPSWVWVTCRRIWMLRLWTLPCLAQAWQTLRKLWQYHLVLPCANAVIQPASDVVHELQQHPPASASARPRLHLCLPRCMPMSLVASPEQNRAGREPWEM